MKQNKKLSCTICGIEFENPFILASAPPTSNISSIKRAFDLGWGGAVLKTISPDHLKTKDVSPRFATMKINNQIIGFENIELLSTKGFSYWRNGIIELKKLYPHKVLLASIMAPTERLEWQNLVKELQALPIDGFELNFSCPHGMPEQGIGMAIGTDAKIATKITKWVMKVAKKPVFVKLSPNVTSISEIAIAINKAKPDGFAAINTVQSMMGIDLDTLKPKPCVNGYSTFGGYSGQAIRPIGLRCVAQISKSIDKPILGMGGISSFEDAIQYIAVGADAVQICTEVMINGYGIIKPWLKSMEKYLDKHGINNISELKGLALKSITSHESLNKKQRQYACIDDTKCKNCKKCITICNESGYQAIELLNNKPEVKVNKCDGCSLCQHICPYQAISMMD